MNDDKPLKGLILSAGLGSRLRPLTDFLPKPMAQVLGSTLFEAAARRLAAAGIQSLACNVHHLWERMSAHAEATARAIRRPIVISKELPSILGTGGPLVALADWWDNDNLLVYNGDVLTNIDIQALSHAHVSKQALVTLVVQRGAPAKGAGRSVWRDPQSGHVVLIADRKEMSEKNPATIRDLEETRFACAYIASPKFRSYLPAQPTMHDVIASFNDALNAGEKIATIVHSGFFADVGTTHSLYETNLALVTMPPPQMRDLLGAEGVRIHPTVRIHPRAQVDERSVISQGVTIDQDSHVMQSVLLPLATVQKDERLHRVLRGYGIDQSF